VATAVYFDWIKRKPCFLDDERSTLWLAPRKKGTAVSENNTEWVEQLPREYLKPGAGIAKT
jgi:hypothetical protein